MSRYKIVNKTPFIALLLAVLMAGCGGGMPSAGTPAVSLGTAASFAVLAGSTVTNTGTTTMVTGDLGLSPGLSVSAFPPGTLNGTRHATDAAAAQAQVDLTAAYNDAATRSMGSQPLPGNLGGMTLSPGLYTNASSVLISGPGAGNDVTLNANGDANAVFIFQIGSTLTTATDSQVILTGGAQAKNIFWQVGSSATLGTNSVFEGTILAQDSITLNNGATLAGRALARAGAVTLDTNTVTTPMP